LPSFPSLPSSRRWVRLLPGLLALLGLCARGDLQADVALAGSDDAYVVETAGGWIVGSAGVSLTISANPASGVQLASVGDPKTGSAWAVSGASDALVTLQNRRVTPGVPAVPLRGVQAGPLGNGVRLQLAFEDTATHLNITRSYAVFPGSPAVEIWTTYAADASTPAVLLSDVGIWQASVRADVVHWVSGLQVPDARGGRFTRQQQALGSRLSLSLGAEGRSSESAVPAVWFDGAPGHLLAGLAWSGAWKLMVNDADAAGRSAVRLSLGDVATTVRAGQPFETPHGFLGVSAPGDQALASSWQAFAANGVRHGRPLGTLVTANTWFAHGTSIDEDTIRGEMDRAAASGVELFVVDAGWYVGGRSADDYTTGLGTWTADPRRFPSGLRALSDYAHGLGMKFGIWVEPERIDTATINRAGLVRERYLATVDGRYNPGVRNESADAALVCLGDTEARQWVYDQIVRFVDDVSPDYLKWDNNAWVNCNRTSHGHGERDGNLAQVRGLYGILAALRDRYPDLMIEDCAQGGNRLDFGMLQYTDSAWMDDVTSPSSHVRHNLEGLSAVFPSGWLLSFVMDDPDEPIHGADDLMLILRSRMAGVLGFSIRTSDFQNAELAAIRREVSAYKRFRSILTDGAATLLTPQVPAGGGVDADVIQVMSEVTGDVVMFMYDGAGQAPARVALPKGLDPDALYATQWRRGMAVMSGGSLLANGLELPPDSPSAAHVVVLTRRSGQDTAPVQ
jgi:alpha-galactosidase